MSNLGPIRYAWTMTGLRPSELAHGPTRYISEHDYDAAVRELQGKIQDLKAALEEARQRLHP